MKKILFISLICLFSCKKENINCYECYYHYYNHIQVKVDTGIVCVSEKEIREIEYKNNAKCELK